MRIFIENCFHWIGFHIVNKLLEEGYEVVGERSKNRGVKEEYLFDFFGRNAAFSLSESKENNDYDCFISVNKKIPESNTKTIIQIKKYNEEGFLVQQIELIVSLLVGEWMPIKKDGVLVQNKLIHFHSKLFTEAIYIGDFINACMQLLKSTNVSPIINIKSCKTGKMEKENLEKYIYIRDNRSKDEIIELLKKHYQRHKHFYET
ncbi:hypothetical protein FHP05_10100 [Cerasibacillus terrae]|uniref:Uncharacterized protein n=1 Tax=Cerasibacillus terrae TaxID=2498845 RepID=A0A5C8NSU0_9BACI|nr:hypothetical protein [Cerasibacillus terrae]TXL64031.1 hypothetical protein FHP05_10100 [Cerasibacillus terrae]